MTYRELLKLYKQGKLEDSTKKKEQYQISLIWRVGGTISMI